MRGSSLSRRFPQAEAIPRIALGAWPTPVTSYPALAHALDLEEFWIKCDGNCHPVYGGNKVRKLEFVLADALAQRAQGIRTFCTTGSHHGLATTTHGRPLGLEVELLQIPQPETPHVRETIELLGRSGARRSEVSSPAWLAPAALRAAWRDLRTGERWRWVPAGGSSPLGTLGYLDAGLELAEQIREGKCPEPSRIYVALSTGATFAGLWAGCALAGLQTRVIGVRVADAALANAAVVRWLAAGALARLLRVGALSTREALRILARPIQIEANQLGAGYGQATRAAQEALTLLEAHGGPALETTYTGKALAALIAEARGGGLQGQRVLLWNTFNLRPPPGSVC